MKGAELETPRYRSLRKLLHLKVTLSKLEENARRILSDSLACPMLCSHLKDWTFYKVHYMTRGAETCINVAPLIALLKARSINKCGMFDLEV